MGETTPQDLSAMIEENLPLVKHIVFQVAVHFPRHVDRDELARAGALGLVEAAKRYDEARGVPFNRFAAQRIRGAIIDGVRAADWAPRSVRALARRLDQVELVAGHAERLGGLTDRGDAPELCGQALLGGVQATGQGSHRAGSPVRRSDGVDDRAPDALGGETVERNSAGLVVALCGLDQAEGTGPGQLVAVDVAGEVHRDLEHDVVDQVQVLLDQPGGVPAARRTPVRDQGPLGVPGRSVLGKCCAHVAVSLLVVFRVSPRDQPDPGDCPRGIGARTRRT